MTTTVITPEKLAIMTDNSLIIIEKAHSIHPENSVSIALTREEMDKIIKAYQENV